MRSIGAAEAALKLMIRRVRHGGVTCQPRGGARVTASRFSCGGCGRCGLVRWPRAGGPRQRLRPPLPRAQGRAPPGRAAHGRGGARPRRRRRGGGARRPDGAQPGGRDRRVPRHGPGARLRPRQPGRFGGRVGHLSGGRRRPGQCRQPHRIQLPGLWFRRRRCRDRRPDREPPPQPRGLDAPDRDPRRPGHLRPRAPAADRPARPAGRGGRARHRCRAGHRHAGRERHHRPVGRLRRLRPRAHAGRVRPAAGRGQLRPSNRPARARGGAPRQMAPPSAAASAMRS